jgi:hypothetical protein
MLALVEILAHFEFLKEKYQMDSLNMGEIADLLENGNFTDA